MEEQTQHYVCTGTCAGVSPTPTNCQAGDCSKHDQPLKACNCADGQHAPAHAE